MKSNFTEKDIEDLIKLFIPSPNKEKPLKFWTMGHLIKNDGENLYVLLEDESWQKIDAKEFYKNRIVKYID